MWKVVWWQLCVCADMRRRRDPRGPTRPGSRSPSMGRAWARSRSASSEKLFLKQWRISCSSPTILRERGTREAFSIELSRTSCCKVETLPRVMELAESVYRKKYVVHVER